MRARSSSASTSAAATAAARRTEPDAVALEPIGDHRIIIHLSRATRSFCLETGEQFLRQAGDIDVVPSGAIGGFVAETPYQSLQIRLAPGMLDHAASRSRQLAAARLTHHHMLRNDRIVLLGQALESDVKAGSPSGPLFAENVGNGPGGRIRSTWRMIRRERPSASRTRNSREFWPTSMQTSTSRSLSTFFAARPASAAHICVHGSRRPWTSRSIATS